MNYSALIFNPLTAIEGTVSELNNNFELLPTAITSLKTLNKFPLAVIKVKALSFLPSLMWKPSACNEKSPLLGSKPACNPCKLVMYTPFPIFSNNWSSDNLPGFKNKLPKETLTLLPFLCPLPVDSTPSFLAVPKLCKYVVKTPFLTMNLSCFGTPSSSMKL